MIIANSIVLGATIFMEKYKPKNNILRKIFVFTPSNLEALTSQSKLIEEIKIATTIYIISAEVLKINKVKNEVKVLITYKVLNDQPSN